MYQTLLLATSATHLQHGHRFKTPMWHNNILLFFSVPYRFVTTAFLFLLHNLTNPSIFICSVHFLAASIGPNFPTKGGILERSFCATHPLPRNVSTMFVCLFGTSTALSFNVLENDLAAAHPCTPNPNARSAVYHHMYYILQRHITVLRNNQKREERPFMLHDTFTMGRLRQ